MEKQENFIFYNKYDLKGLVYNINLPSKNKSEVVLLSKKIIDLGGKISFSISDDTIIILEQIRQKTIEKMLMKYNEYDKVVIFNKEGISFFLNDNKKNMLKNSESDKTNLDNFKIQKLSEFRKKNITQNQINELKKEKRFGIIKLNDLEKILQNLEKFSMENHFRNGLPQNVDLNCTVSFLIPSNDHKKNMSLYFHTFESLAVHNSNKKFYDIPRYSKSAPEGFSIFMTYREKRRIQEYLKSVKDKSTDLLNEGNLNGEDDKQPLPHKLNRNCNLCRVYFENYIEHIESDVHKYNIANHQISYLKINESLKFIRDFWAKKNKEKKHEKIVPSSFDDKIHNNLLNLKINKVNSVNIKRKPSDKEIQIIDLTDEDNFSRHDTKLENADNLLNSLYPDINSPSTKILTTEILKNEKIISGNFAVNKQLDNDNKFKEVYFLRKKRENPNDDKKCKLNETKGSEKSRKNLKSHENKPKYYSSPNIKKRLLRSNAVEKLNNDDSLKTFYKFVLGNYSHIKKIDNKAK